MPRADLSHLPVFGEYGWVRCPVCGEQSLHHRRVCISDRSEDAAKGKVVFVNGIGDWNPDPNFEVQCLNDVPMPLNPSPRRGGLIIEFDCEHCTSRPQLGVFQHKGITLIEWFDLGLPEEEIDCEPDFDFGFKADTPKRQPIKPSVRFQILKRNDYRCQLCGTTANDGTKLEIDHIVPVAKGGTNDLSNLQVLCRDCNSGKSDNML